MGTRIATFRALIDVLAPAFPGFYFIQVGANDGRSGDPVYPHVKRHGWRGVAIELQRHVFQLLKKTYEGFAGITLENVAIADQNGTMDLHRIAFSERRWATGLATLVPDQLTTPRSRAHINRSIEATGDAPPSSEEDYITTERVRTMTFEALLDKHRPARVDLLQIDAEGYDHVLLELYDFERMPPMVVHYEHHNTPSAERNRTLQMLKDRGYFTFRDAINTVAIERSLAEALGAAFPSRVEPG